MVERAVLKAAIAFFNIFLLLGCGSVKYSSVASGILNRTWTPDQESPSEKDYCTDEFIYAKNYSISGKASYEYRPIGIEVNNEGLLDIADEPLPIRHAQFDVTDASGTILQCGETDAEGNFSFLVPQNGKALSLNIYARSDNTYNRASVFIAPETNELHKLQYFFTANANRSGSNIIAEGDKSLIGGAFNILDQIHKSFDALYLNVDDGEGIDPEDIPKTSIYWEKGFNPGIYVGQSSGLSFFSKPQQKLFILGGSNGDTDFADTDHFDNSIILHEYFHFLESSISISDSPGGLHTGNQLLDPRVAWSEGAAQFYQAFVTGIPTVLDTRGNSDGATGFYLKLSVENETTDIPIEKGEGEFREFAVARMLWDIHDTEDGEGAPEAFDNVNGYFSNFWRAFSESGTSADFNHSSATFASSSLLLEIINAQTSISGNADWNTLLLHSFITQPSETLNDNFRAEYGQSLISDIATTASFTFTGPYFLPSSNLINNHPVVSMDYYSLILSSGTSQSLSISSTTDFQKSGKDGAVQFYVFEDGYTDLTDYIQGPIDEGATISLNGGPDGTVYMIVVVVSTAPVAAALPVEAVINYEFADFNLGGF